MNVYICKHQICTDKYFNHHAEKYLQILSVGCLYLQSFYRKVFAITIQKSIRIQKSLTLTLFAQGLSVIIHLPHFPFKQITPPPPYIKDGLISTEVRSVALFLDHFFKKQESSLITEEDQMSLSWPPRQRHENRVTRNGADLIWLGCQVITGQYLDIVNTHHSL